MRWIGPGAGPRDHAADVRGKRGAEGAPRFCVVGKPVFFIQCGPRGVERLTGVPLPAEVPARPDLGAAPA